MKINHAILHILDFDSAVNVMSQRELDIESRTVRNFVTTHLRRARTSTDNKRATFAENSAFGGELKGYFFGEREFVRPCRSRLRSLSPPSSPRLRKPSPPTCSWLILTTMRMPAGLP